MNRVFLVQMSPYEFSGISHTVGVYEEAQLAEVIETIQAERPDWSFCVEPLFINNIDRLNHLFEKY
jgi:hypothetical protein